MKAQRDNAEEELMNHKTNSQAEMKEIIELNKENLIVERDAAVEELNEVKLELERIKIKVSKQVELGRVTEEDHALKVNALISERDSALSQLENLKETSKIDLTAKITTFKQERLRAMEKFAAEQTKKQEHTLMLAAAEAEVRRAKEEVEEMKKKLENSMNEVDDITKKRDLALEEVETIKKNTACDILALESMFTKELESIRKNHEEDMSKKSTEIESLREMLPSNEKKKEAQLESLKVQ